MKEIVLNLALLAVLSIAFSSLTGCGGANTAQQDPPSTPIAPSNQTTTKASDYPPVSAGIAKGAIKNLDGTTFTVEDKKGKVLLLNLWATWCGPCRSEMPTLVKMQNDYRDKNFEIIGLNTDDEPASVINIFKDQMKLNYTLVWSDAQLQGELLKVSKFGGIPQSFLIDREGRLRSVFTGANANKVQEMAEIVGKVVNEQ
ncbi:MAG: TlpA disulfide reductase family protein [Acidobacteriota bacterium]